MNLLRKDRKSKARVIFALPLRLSHQHNESDFDFMLINRFRRRKSFSAPHGGNQANGWPAISSAFESRADGEYRVECRRAARRAVSIWKASDRACGSPSARKESATLRACSRIAARSPASSKARGRQTWRRLRNTRQEVLSEHLHTFYTGVNQDRVPTRPTPAAEGLSEDHPFIATVAENSFAARR